VINAFITILMIMILNFALFRLMPGDPAKLMTPHDPNTPDALYWRNVERMGLNDSAWEQLLTYFYQTFTGDWGISFYYESSVTSVMGGSITWTLFLLGTSSVLTFLMGIVLGKIAALRRGKIADVSITGFGLFFYGMPIFWFGLVLMIMFVSIWPIFPTGGYITAGDKPFPLTGDKIIDILKHLVLPATTLTIGSVAGIVLIMRNSLVDVLTEEYIVTAYAKGLTGRQVMKGHASPNARLPIVTTIAMDTAFILGGAFQVEYIYSYRGIGWETINAIDRQDFPVLQFIFLIGGIAVVIANLIADLVLVKLDPRVSIT